jgi:hypothetical protein
MLQRRGSLAVLCCLFAFTWFWLAVASGDSKLALVLRHRDDDAIVFCRHLATDRTFRFVFTHSMFGGDVVESYRINTDLTLTRSTVTADTAGAADYYGLYGEAVRNDGQYALLVPPLVVQELRFIAGDRANYRLEARHWTYVVDSAGDGVDHLILRVEQPQACQR